MIVTDEIKRYAKILFGIYILCLFWIVILKCNLRQGVLDSYEYYIRFTLFERIRFQLGRFFITDAQEILINIFIFTPVGLVLPFIKEEKPILSCVVFGFSLSLVLEIAQLVFCIGAFSYIDLINNILGALVGVLIHMILRLFVGERLTKFILIAAIIYGVCLSIHAIDKTIENIDIYMPIIRGLQR